MARNDATPWLPGNVLLTETDLLGKNPYTGRRLNQRTVLNIVSAIALTCNQCDANISLIQRQSKLLE